MVNRSLGGKVVEWPPQKDSDGMEGDDWILFPNESINN
jgi:hypothetical protein